MRLRGGGVRGVGVLAGLFGQALLLLLLFPGELFLSLLEVELWSCQVDRLSPSPGIPAGAPYLRLIWLANVRLCLKTHEEGFLLVAQAQRACATQSRVFR